MMSSAPTVASALRTRDSSTRTDASADAGGSPSHRAATSSSGETARPELSASRTTNARSLPPRMGTPRPLQITSSGPRIRITTGTPQP